MVLFPINIAIGKPKIGLEIFCSSLVPAADSPNIHSPSHIVNLIDNSKTAHPNPVDIALKVDLPSRARFSGWRLDSNYNPTVISAWKRV